MGLIAQEINELRGMLKSFKAGTLSSEDLHSQLAIYAQTEKRARNLLTAAALAVKIGHKSRVKQITGVIVGVDDAVDDEPEIYDRTKDRGKNKK